MGQAQASGCMRMDEDVVRRNSCRDTIGAGKSSH